MGSLKNVPNSKTAKGEKNPDFSQKHTLLGKWTHISVADVSKEPVVFWSSPRMESWQIPGVGW